MKIYGDLERRIKLSRNRLKDKTYRVPDMFNQSENWPGDWPGRTILALTSLYQISNTNEEKEDVKKQLTDIIEALDNHINEDKYFGELVNLEKLNEQQLSGNSWFVRGLCEYHSLFKDAKTLEILETISKKYLAKLEKSYKKYPLISREKGRVDGHILEDIYDGWLLSSDIGCAFIMLDGITHLYQITKHSHLVSIIETMIDKFMSIDVLKYELQTHATLSALRGIFRYYKLTNNKKYLDHVINRFDTYVNYGMTLNYANMNWFNRKTWTEICAVVDSFIVSKNLFVETNNIIYLELMDRIYKNGIIISQRHNGGAGCETCLMEQKDELKMFLYEAFFCCTMRFPVGLKEKANSIILPYLNSFIITELLPGLYNLEDKTVVIEEINQNQYKIKISENMKEFYIYCPKNSSITIDKNEYKNIAKLINDGTPIEISFKKSRYQEKTKGVIINFVGNQILTIKNNEKKHTPILDASLVEEEKLKEIIQKL